MRTHPLPRLDIEGPSGLEPLQRPARLLPPALLEDGPLPLFARAGAVRARRRPAGSVRRPETSSTLAGRQVAMGCAAESAVPFDLATLWRNLELGRSRVLDSFHSAQRYYVVFENVGRVGTRLTSYDAKRARICQRVFHGHSQKAISLEFGIAASSVTGALKRALGSFGLDCRVATLSPLLTLAAGAALHHRRAQATIAPLPAGVPPAFVVNIPRPERHVARHLSTAEFEVLSRFVEGLTYEQIAQERGRSSRTIANQISAVFRKLRVSGRRELLALLAAREHELLGGAPQDCPFREL